MSGLFNVAIVTVAALALKAAQASAAAPNTLSAGLQVGFIVCLLYSYFRVGT
jgi:hypothetical protein